MFYLENTNAELNLNNFTFDNFQETESFKTIETPSEISHHEDTRLLGDKDIFKRKFWQMFLEVPLADFCLVFEDGTVMVNKAVLAVLSRNLADILCPHHDCLQLADFSRKTFLGFLELLSQSSDVNTEMILPQNVAELVKLLDISTILNSSQYLEPRGLEKPHTSNHPRGDIKVEVPARPSRPDTNVGDDEEEEEEREENSPSVEHVDNCVEMRLSQLSSPEVRRDPRLSRPAGRPPGSRNGSGRGKTCEDCGGKVLDRWKHARQCIAINNDIK